jgi:hypothetical protein
MLAYEIEIDGRKYATAGVEDWSILSLHVTASRAEENSKVRDGYLECSVGGLTVPDGGGIRHHFRWTNAPLNIGSRICNDPAIPAQLTRLMQKRPQGFAS